MRRSPTQTKVSSKVSLNWSHHRDAPDTCYAQIYGGRYWQWRITLLLKKAQNDEYKMMLNVQAETDGRTVQ